MSTTIDRVGRSDTETPARVPDQQGFVDRDGVRVHWEAYGHGEPAILLMPTWSVIHSRHWKAQIPYLARHFRVVAYDGRGNGLSDRPQVASAYAAREFVADAVAVLDAAGVESACVAGLSMGGLRALLLAAEHPERVDGVFLIDASIPLLTPAPPEHDAFGFDDERDDYEGWAKYNRHYWLRDHRGFLEFFFGQVFHNEPHSTKQIDDLRRLGPRHDPRDADPDRVDAQRLRACRRGGGRGNCAAAVRARCCVIHGSRDRDRPVRREASGSPS